MSKLVIVESPSKAKTIEKYLPGDFRVRASLGHVRDLPKNAKQLPKKYKKKPWARLGVDTENDFRPIYVVNDQRSKKALKELKAELKEADALYLATDEDREGEAISWHLIEELSPDCETHRMVFHEITQTAIERALENTRAIDKNLVEAQETRRILDRLVGYDLSPLVAKKIKYGLSAGRVQSVAVRLLVERERERRRFKIGSYWDLKAQLDRKGEDFEAVLRTVDGTRIASGKDFDKNTGKVAEGKDVLLLEEEQAKKMVDTLDKRPWKVADVNERAYTSRPKPPFITSTLQQEASRKLGMSASQTMSIAQSLYENGLITYMRTDSVNLSKQALSAARAAAKKLYGKKYVAGKPRRYATKSKGAQEAHEAIRPTGDAFVHPKKSGLRGREKRLYDMIWKRTVASQMANAKKTSIRVDLEISDDDHTYIFRANGNRIDFAGFMRAYVEGADDPKAALEDQEKLLPPLKAGEDVDCQSLEAIGHETKPPARFTEASLVRILEEEGVGRPSTYAAIMKKITRDERYARKKGRTLIPTYMAFAVTGFLEEHFFDLVDTSFTARMESDLDEIAAGKGSKVDYLHEFYRRRGAFEDQVHEGDEKIEPKQARVVELEEFPATLKVGRYGPYVQLERDGETKTVDVPEDVPPADLTMEHVEEMLEKRERGPESIGTHPETGEEIFLMDGRYGPYFQLGERTEENKKPKTASVPKGKKPDEVTLEEAVQLLDLPRYLGDHPEDGKPVEAGIGRYGPFVKHKRNYRNLSSQDEVFTVSFEDALELLNKPKGRRRRKILKELGKDPDSGKDINVLDGRYGPYVKLDKTNASLPKGTKPEDMTLEKALELIEEKRAK